MKKQFYDHLISFETLEIELENIHASDEEKKHLQSLAKENVHIAILDRVLSELQDEDKKVFLKHIHLDEHEKIWELLQTKTQAIEEKITIAANAILDELKKDMRELNNIS